MSRDIVNSIVLAALFLSLFAIAELLHHRFKLKADDTRKIVHIGTGLLSMLFPLMLGSQWFVLLLCSSFALILFSSLKFNLLHSINAIDRVSYGCLWYPLAVYACFFTYNYFQNRYLFFYLPVLTMALCDPIAAIFGKRWPYGKFYIKNDKKTIVGCTAFFIASVMLTFCLFYFLSPAAFTVQKVLPVALLIGITATITEAVSVKGLDNISIPVCVIFILTLLHV